MNMRHDAAPSSTCAAVAVTGDHIPYTQRMPAACMRSAGEPVTFEGTVALFTPALGTARPLAVLFASPWGLEEMCTRKFRRILCEQLASEGMASLRFDYPGTGDALDEAPLQTGWEAWEEALVAAARILQERSGCGRLVIVAEGLGAIVASLAADRLAGLEAVAFLAPVVSGRAHLRELTVFSRMIDDKLGLKTEADGAVEVAGLVLPRAIAERLRSVNLMKLHKAPSRNLAVFARTGHPGDAAFASHLRALGGAVLEAPFEGFEKLTSNPTLALVPEPVVKRLVSWVTDLAPRGSDKQAELEPAREASHSGAGFVETAVRFGRDGRMFGIVCSPPDGAPQTGPAVLFLSSGYDRHAGWGRSTVAYARALAREGIGSLRFDCANAADSPPVDGVSGQVLYDSAQVEDVREAVDFLREAGMSRVVAAGRCSGAYLGLQSAVADERIAGVVAVNPIVFRWKEGRSVDDALENPVQTLEHYGRRLAEKDTLRRVLRGEINVLRKGGEVLGRLSARAIRPLAAAVGGISARERAVFSDFRALRSRGVPVVFLYGAGELGLDEFALFFGKDANGLRRFTNVRFSVVADTDHNFTPVHAQARYLDAIRSLVKS